MDQKVFDVVSREGLFTKDVNEFKNKYVGKQQGVTPTGAGVTSTSTSFASDDIVLASPEEAFNIEEPKAYKSILESQQVTDEDLTKISTKRSEELQKLVNLGSELGLEDTSEASVINAISEINDYEKRLSRARRGDKFAISEMMKLPSYNKHIKQKEILSKSGFDLKTFEKANKDFNIVNTAEKAYVQDIALSKFMKDKGIDLENLDEDKKQEKKSEILNSEEYKTFENTISETLTDEQKKEQKEKGANALVDSKADALLEDRVFSELERQDKEVGMSGLMYDILELGDLSPSGKIRGRKRDILEAEAKQDLDKINKV
jgi:hypothetical protein